MKPFATASQRAIVDVLQRIYLAILESVRAVGDTGAPDGVLFAAPQARGATLTHYRWFTASTKARDFVTLDATCYRPTAAGAAFVPSLIAIVERKTASRSLAVLSPNPAR